MDTVFLCSSPVAPDLSVLCFLSIMTCRTILFKHSVRNIIATIVIIYFCAHVCKVFIYRYQFQSFAVMLVLLFVL